ncbi:DUF3667 domain-containing protein [Litorimonas sp. RW-G-Af-16]|uniref:DUF3667 domain-containing protein n=1 Tax=Litorimonas sp. RW-G-Af-16 TaxID=3241168 RepID=UPI00390C47E4
MGTDEHTDFEDVSLLDNDSIPNANQSLFCFSCNAPMQGLFCAACGQKNDNFRRSLLGLLSEALASITAIESRIWRTWGALIAKPGKVAREFADGRRTYWSSPVRVYLAMSLILFGFMSVAQIQFISLDVDVAPRAGVDVPIKDLTAETARLSWGIDFFARQKTIDARNANKDFDLINQVLTANNFNFSIGEATSIDDPETIKSLDAKFSEISNKLRADDREDLAAIWDAQKAALLAGETSLVGLDLEDALQKDYDTLRAELIGSKERIDAIRAMTEDSKTGTSSQDGQSWTNINGEKVEPETLQKAMLHIIQDPSRVNEGFRTTLPRLMFAMMPFTMLIGAMFIRGRGNALLYDHLVHAAYVHAFAYFLLLVAILISWFMPIIPMMQVTFIILLIYLPLSLRRMFGRSWLKTIWTSYGVGFVYLFAMFVILTTLLATGISSEISATR